MRISKDGVVRKQELLDAALHLFQERGYEKTSVQAIIRAVGVSKGAFYYYFQSKEDVLEFIASQQAGRIIEIARQAAGRPDLSALEKINRLIGDILAFKTKNLEQRLQLFQIFRGSENIKLSRRMLEHTVALARPILQAIFEQGVREGSLDTPCPDELAGIYIRLINNLNVELGELLLEIGRKPEHRQLIRRKLACYEDLIGRILGARKGSIVLAERIWQHLLPLLADASPGDTTPQGSKEADHD